jgi:hypothetical protein
LVENTVKRAKGAKVKSPFPRTTHDKSFLCWFIIYNFIFWIPLLALHFKYKII